ncbi:MAG TPA: cytochrome c [Anaeromyxobacteraceae bacterium]|nr:cytochrome c [Anaeromyxobacteraceae bacterium]
MHRTWLAATAVLALCACERDVPPAYRSVVVPSSRLGDPAARQRGRELFARHCALCHGERGDGRGQRRAGLSMPPRDLSDPDWQARTSSLRIFVAVREGVPGTSMPAWAALSAEDTWDLVAYVRSLAIR